MIDEVIAHIDAHRTANAGRLMELLRVPSISTEPARDPDTRRGAEWVHGLLDACGIKTEIIETARHPCVLADSGPAGNGGPPSIGSPIALTTRPSHAASG